MEMGIGAGQFFSAPLKAAVQAGRVPTGRFDEMVTRIVHTMFRIGIFDHPAAAEPGASRANVSRSQDVALARTIAEDGTVLLENRHHVLPLTRRGHKIAVIGPGAGPQGAEEFYNGSGSSHVPEVGDKGDVVSPLAAISRRAAALGDAVTYADGSSTAAAVAAARAARVAVVFVGSQDSEGVDRSTLGLGSGSCSFSGCVSGPIDQDELISQVAAANPRTVVVLNTGGPVLMPWRNRIEGLLEAWYPGQQDGNAIAALLFGDVDPSAKLPETFPASGRDLPTQTGRQYPGVADAGGVPQAVYSEGLLIGYRWYAAKRIAPFPFGFGLSYTMFSLHGLHVAAGGGRGRIAKVSFDVTNTGSRAGAEVAQLYVADPRSAGEPPRQLKGFAKVALRPKARRRVTLALDFSSVAHWSSSAQRWRATRGCYRILVGSSSRDLPLSSTVAVGSALCERGGPPAGALIGKNACAGWLDPLGRRR
jgi:beta-glucosidase